MEQTKKVITKNYENGNQQFEYRLVGRVLDGWQRDWYENGNNRFECYYSMGAPTGVWRVYWESGAERFTVNLPKREVTINGVVTKEYPIDSICDTKDEGLWDYQEGMKDYQECDDSYFIGTMEDLIHSDDNHSWTCPVEIREKFSRDTTSDYQEVERFE